MSRTKKIILMTLIVMILLLGIGYAAIQNITLNISGAAIANPNQGNFEVKIDEVLDVSDEMQVSTEIINATNATIQISGLTSVGDVAFALYKIKNVSTDLSADISVSTSNNNPRYFSIISEIDKTSLTAGEEAELLVIVELTKTPVMESVSSTIGVQLEAIPVQPGEEGSSNKTNEFSQTPGIIEEITTNDITSVAIGDYIDLGNNIIGTESTQDDWRILYRDEDTVYVILADYLYDENLLNETTDIGYNYLTTDANWGQYTNGIRGANVTGAPTAELLINSYNAKNKTELVYTDTPTLERDTEDFDLYVPKNPNYSDGVLGYWLATNASFDNMMGYYIYIDKVENINRIALQYWGTAGIFARPVVALPTDLSGYYMDGIWVIN